MLYFIILIPQLYREGYDGGIWQVDESIFDQTQDTTTHPELASLYTQINSTLGIYWPSSTWVDLRRPLYSALAARLFFATVGEDIPMSGDLQGQAEYWKTHFNTDPGDTVQDFLDSVNELESLGKYACMDVQLNGIYGAWVAIVS